MVNYKLKKINDAKFLLDEISNDISDMKNDVQELQYSVNETNKLVLLLQEQCQEFFTKIEKNIGDKKNE